MSDPRWDEFVDSLYASEILIPHTPGVSVERDRSLQVVLDFYRDHGRGVETVRVVENPERNKPKALNEAVAMLAAARDLRPNHVLVFNDADSLCPVEQLSAMIHAAWLEGGLVLGFTSYLWLSEASTRTIWSLHERYGKGWQYAFAEPAEAVMADSGSTGCCAIRYGDWLRVGGMDERFGGWGYDDLAFCARCVQVGVKVRRVRGELTHLWHPREPDNPANRRLYEREYAGLM